MLAHFRMNSSFEVLLFAICLFGCQQKPFVEYHQITDAERTEREKILMPIIDGLVEDKRGVFHAPNVEGKLAADYQRLLDLADRVRHDPVNRKTVYFYLQPHNSSLEVNKEDEFFHILTIAVREKYIESAELPPPMDR